MNTELLLQKQVDKKSTALGFSGTENCNHFRYAGADPGAYIVLHLIGVFSKFMYIANQHAYQGLIQKFITTLHYTGLKGVAG